MQSADENEKKSTHMKEFLSAFERGRGKPGAAWVLIVDDEPSIRHMVSRSMMAVDKALIVHEAENGREALEVLQAVRKSAGRDPLLIVTDLQMPVMDGWDFIDRLQKENEKAGRASGVPLIVLSASSGEKGFFSVKSVHGESCKYTPMIAIAKEDCVKPMKYDSKGEKGLGIWIKYFLS
ncbi:hypothetical protein BH09SUM1_BH09SUM1_16830 [soil metagenome]